MSPELQRQLLQELLGLEARKALYLDDAPSRSPVQHYLDPERFAREQQRVFGALPAMLAHSSELAAPNSFLRRTVQGQPLLLLRGDDGVARVFYNVCRHRGTRLVEAQAGCKARHVCPYHAWSWNSRGEFVAAPHFEAGFPDARPEELGLAALRCEERHGFVWLLPESFAGALADFLGPLDAELAWVGTSGLAVHAADTQLRRCNWKMIAEGGLEAYHFRVAHRNTIAKLFHDNLSSYQVLGPHMRSILPRTSMAQLREQAPEHWALRAHANVLYSLFPGSVLLVQHDHVVWIQVEPLAVDSTLLRLVTLKPADSTAPTGYWDKNHALTLTTLNEDFDLAESIQSGLHTGANTALRFGRFEGALQRFNETVQRQLDGAPQAAGAAAG